MPEDKDQQPIIIIKKKGGHGAEHHGGTWKVAYADFVTSMMAFFLVMWLIAQSETVKQNIAGYFQDPSGFKKGGSKSVLPKAGVSIIQMKSQNSMSKEADRRLRELEQRKELQKAANEIMKKLKVNPTFAMLKDQIEVQMTAEGFRIQLLETEGDPFFESGSSELKPRAKLLLKIIADELGKLPNKVIIEGHTDSYQYAEKANYTNWELSADRCNSTRRWMKDNGLRPDQMAEVRGFADTEPKIKDNPADARNRRIAIIVQNDFSGLNYLDKNVILNQDEIEGKPPQPQAVDSSKTEAAAPDTADHHVAESGPE